MDEIYKSAEILNFFVENSNKINSFIEMNYYDFMNFTLSGGRDTFTIEFDDCIVFSIRFLDGIITIYPKIYGQKDFFQLHFEEIKDEIKNFTYDTTYDKLADIGRKLKLPSVFEKEFPEGNDGDRFTLDELYSLYLNLKEEIGE